MDRISKGVVCRDTEGVSSFPEASRVSSFSSAGSTCSLPVKRINNFMSPLGGEPRVGLPLLFDKKIQSLNGAAAQSSLFYTEDDEELDSFFQADLEVEVEPDLDTLSIDAKGVQESPVFSSTKRIPRVVSLGARVDRSRAVSPSPQDFLLRNNLSLSDAGSLSSRDTPSDATPDGLGPLREFGGYRKLKNSPRSISPLHHETAMKTSKSAMSLSATASVGFGSGLSPRNVVSLPPLNLKKD